MSLTPLVVAPLRRLCGAPAARAYGRMLPGAVACAVTNPAPAALLAALRSPMSTVARGSHVILGGVTSSDTLRMPRGGPDFMSGASSEGTDDSDSDALTPQRDAGVELPTKKHTVTHAPPAAVRQPRSSSGAGRALSAGASASSIAKAKAPLANEGIKFPEVRLINAAGENLNVVPIERARALAAEAGMDLVVTALHATPPVCRIMRMAAVMEKLKKAASAQRASQKHSQPKEMRYTARITDHDMEVKTNQVIKFLKDGRTVKVSVSFTMSAWVREEPTRREVMGKILKLVAEAGVGQCDANSIKGEGGNLYALFTPATSPKTLSDMLARSLERLAQPIVPHGAAGAAGSEATLQAVHEGADAAAAASMPSTAELQNIRGRKKGGPRILPGSDEAPLDDGDRRRAPVAEDGSVPFVARDDSGVRVSGAKSAVVPKGRRPARSTTRR